MKGKLIPIMILFSMAFQGLSSQDLQIDVIPTSNGELEITFIAHGTLMLSYNDLVIHVDPVGMFGTDYSKLPKADLILITHEHPDHLDANLIQQIKTENTVILLNARSYESLGQGEVMANGDHKTVSGIDIDAVPAYNLTAANHPKGIGNGYVLTFSDKKVYIAGDTENIPEMSELKDIDIAFLPMNAPTMNVQMAAEAVTRFRPAVLYPYHYGDSNLDELTDLLKDIQDTEVRIRKM